MLFNRNVIFAGKSQYGEYRVVDAPYNGRRARLLYGSNNSPQSGAALDDEPELLFDYNQRFLEIIQSQQPKKILIIGGGAFMLPIAAYHQFANISIDVVEIDQLLVDIARRFFDLPRSSRLHVIVDDGINYIKHCDQTYDMIFIDAFSGFTIPPHLYDIAATRHYKNRLSKNGIVAINFISEYKARRKRLAHEIIAEFYESFSHLLLFQSDPDYRRGEEQNMILVGANHTMSFDYLQSESIEIT